ncbi:MAG: hypothetical protein PHQ59_04455 [Candidatus Daviesbacteria bacterium]|nr:hypothetical protein [Candidatus Daviesbacteria bacterium]
MKKSESGQVLVLAIIVVGLVLLNSLAIIGGANIYSQNTYYSVQSTHAVDLAEAGVDKALASLNLGGSYSGDTELNLDNGSVSIKVTSPNQSSKIIESTGYYPSKQNPKSQKTVKITASKGVGYAFNYGVLVGEGGFEMENNSSINGSVYSNGNISMSNNAFITGDVFVAGGTAPLSDQQNICSSPSCSDYTFGKNIAGNDVLDVAQSFKPSISGNINKISLRLKKVGTPSDIVVRLMADSGGKPDKGNVLTTGTLTANLVTTSYNWVDITFNSPVSLSLDTTYWIMLDTSSNNSNYWVWSADSLQSYTRGNTAWSSNWSVRNPVWTSALYDLDFKTYMGGVVTSIIGAPGVTIGGSAHADNLENLAISGSAYYQTKNNITAAKYYPNSTDPLPANLPVSEGNISEWKQRAQDAVVYTGDISSCRTTLGPGKYVGNVTFANGCNVVINDPIWITGNLDLNNNSILRLNSNYAESSGVIVVDGIITMANNVNINGSGTAGSYIMVLTTYDSRVNGQTALSVNNSTSQGILYAGLGIAHIANVSHLTELTAWKVKLDNGVTINYDTGLSSPFFSSGPSGSYSIVKGTYQIK